MASVLQMEDLSDFLGQFDLKLYLKAKNHIFHKYICECPQIPNFVFRLIWQITDYKLSKIVPILIHLCLNGFYVSKLSFLSDVYLFFLLKLSKFIFIFDKCIFKYVSKWGSLLDYIYKLQIVCIYIYIYIYIRISMSPNGDFCQILVAQNDQKVNVYLNVLNPRFWSEVLYICPQILPKNVFTHTLVKKKKKMYLYFNNCI